jgi:dienelactone hydrolase
MQSITSFLICRRTHLSYVTAFLFLLLSSAAFAQQPAASATNAAAPAQAQGNPTPAAEAPPKPSAPPGLDLKTMKPLYETIQEDWSSLEIGASKLQPEKPTLAPLDEQDTYTRQLVQVQWRPGDPIDLWIILPKGVKKPPVVLYLYDTIFDTDRFRDDGWARRVTGGGVGAVGFVSALSGHRFHDRPMRQWFISELQESLGSTVHDVKFILDYLAERSEVDMNRVGMFGQGSGGAIAILAAAADSRIKAVDALDPWGDWPDFLAKSSTVADDPEHANYLKPEFLKKVAPLDPIKWLPQMKTQIRIQQVHEDEATPMESKERIKAAAPKQAEVIRFEATSDLSRREGQGRLFEWIKDKTRDSATSASTTVSVAEGEKPQAANAPVASQP